MAQKIIDSLETDLAIGTRSDSASLAAGASLVSLVRQVLTELGASGSGVLDVLGALTDTADDTTDTATGMKLLRQIAEAVNKGTGTALASNKSLADVIGDDGSGNSLAARIGDLTDVADDTVDTATLIALVREVLAQIGVFGGTDITDRLGALTDVAADTTDTATMVALLRQIAEAVNKGTGTAMAANKSVVDVLGDDGSGNSIAARVGDLTDVAADTTDTATIIALLRQIAEAVNNGTGTAIGSNLSLVDIIGAFDGGADPQGDIYQALGVDASNSIKALIDAVQAALGVLTDTADDTTDTATGVALLRQIAEAVNKGTGTPLAADKSVLDVLGDDGSGNSIAARTGDLTDTADDTTDTATIIALLRQIAEAVNNGTGTAIGSNLSLVDLFGAFDGGADPQGDIYQALGVGTTDSVAALLGYIRDNVGRIVRKQVAIDGGAGNGAVGTISVFTVTGLVELEIAAYCSEDLVSGGGGTIELGIAGATATIIAQTAAADLDDTELWTDATPTGAIEAVSTAKKAFIVNASNVIITVAGADVTDGTIEFVCRYKPLSSGAAVAAA